TPHVLTGHVHGEIRIYPNITADGENYDVCQSFPNKVYATGDVGMTGFRLHPDWPQRPYGFAYYVAEPPGHPYGDQCIAVPPDCQKYARLVRIGIEYDADSGVVSCTTEHTVLIEDWCGYSDNHGGGGMGFTDDGDLVLAAGDFSFAEGLVIGGSDEPCFDDADGLPQGNFRAQREDFNHGKLVRVDTDALLKSSAGSSGGKQLLSA
ncbi:unnamed protein product, partial [Phaeothamnion confervicola]